MGFRSLSARRRSAPKISPSRGPARAREGEGGGASPERLTEGDARVPLSRPVAEGLSRGVMVVIHSATGSLLLGNNDDRCAIVEDRNLVFISFAATDRVPHLVSEL